MKNLIAIITLLTISSNVFAKAQILVESNQIEGLESIEHTTCKLYNKDEFFDRKAQKILKKKGYELLDSVPSAEEVVASFDADIDQNTYFVPKKFTTTFQSMNMNGKNSLVLGSYYGLKDNVGGLMADVAGLDMDIVALVMTVQGKDSEEISKVTHKRLAEVLPKCVKRQ